MKSILVILSLVLLTGCFTVDKFAVKHPRKHRAIIDTFVSRGGCIPVITGSDTLNEEITKTDTTYDSTSVKLPSAPDTIYLEGKAIPVDCSQLYQLDTTLPNGLYLKITGGVLTTYVPVTEKTVTHIQKIVTRVEDSTRRKLLEGKLNRSDSTVRAQKLTVSELKSRLTTSRIQFWGLISLIVIIGTGLGFLKFKKII
jgi:hypothetical protein